MSELLSSLFRPVETAIAWLLASLHDLAATAGWGAGTAWLAALIGLVVVVRGALVPVTIRQVRLAHAAARARPALAEIARRYAGRTDPESLRRQLAESRAVRAEHGVSLGLMPLLVQGAVMFGLYRVLADVAAGHPIGAMDDALVASARTARLAGVSLADSVAGAAGVGLPGAAGTGLVILGVGGLAAVITYAATRWLSVPNLVEPQPGEPGAELAASMRRMMPAFAALGLLVSAAFVPSGVLVYWLVSAAWTAVQLAVVGRWAPTPGTAAYAAYEKRRRR